MSLTRLFSRLTRKRLPVSECRGDGRFAVRAVDEEQFQDALHIIGGPKQPKAANILIGATLVPEPAEDPKKETFALEIAGQLVGHLSRPDARRLKKHLQKLGFEECAVEVSARIRGGVRKKRGQPSPYFVTLDLPAFIAGAPKEKPQPKEKPTPKEKTKAKAAATED